MPPPRPIKSSANLQEIPRRNPVPSPANLKAAVSPPLDDGDEAELEREPASLPRWRTARVAAIALALAAVGVALSMLLGSRTPVSIGNPNAKTSSETIQLIPRRVEAPGLIESVSGIRNLSFDVPGRIKAVRIEEGQNVKAGQLIAELENDDVTARLESARADVNAAQARLRITDKNLDAEIVRAKKDVERLQAEFALLKAGPRKEQLDAAAAEVLAADSECKHAEEEETRYRDPSGKYESWSRQLFDQAHWRAQTLAARQAMVQAHLNELQAGSRLEDLNKSAALLASAEAELARQESTRQFQLDLARAQVAQAGAHAADAAAALEKTRLYAPIGGAVIWKFMHGGEAIDALQRQPVAAIADLEHLRIRASVDEADYPHIFKGQAVKITADAFGARAFTGRVDLIGSAAGEKPFTTGEARERMDVRVINVLITLDAPSPLKLGLRVTAAFEER
jgi:HlyD family secretion protein